MQPTGPDPRPASCALAYVAAASSRLRLGTGIIILPQRNPLVLAKEARQPRRAVRRPSDLRHRRRLPGARDSGRDRRTAARGARPRAPTSYHRRHAGHLDRAGERQAFREPARLRSRRRRTPIPGPCSGRRRRVVVGGRTPGGVPPRRRAAATAGTASGSMSRPPPAPSRGCGRRRARSLGRPSSGHRDQRDAPPRPGGPGPGRRRPLRGSRRASADPLAPAPPRPGRASSDTWRTQRVR